jgi:hypothetical protein
MRAVTSVTPPGAQGTISLMTRFGYAASEAARRIANPEAATASAADNTVRRDNGVMSDVLLDKQNFVFKAEHGSRT